MPMSTVNVTELRRNLRAHLDQARKGERILVTSRGEVIAEISPPSIGADQAAAARERLRDSVLRYDAPFEPVIDPQTWDMNRRWSSTRTYCSGGSADLRVSRRARKSIESALQNGPLYLSAISVFEIATGLRRGRIELSRPLEAWLADLFLLPEVRVEPVHASIAAQAAMLGETVHGDPADRIILATARWLGRPLGTSDEKLRASGLASLAW